MKPIIPYIKAKKVSTDINAIVNRETDTDAMSRQAAINSLGVDKINLKARLDEDYENTKAQLDEAKTQLAETEQQITKRTNTSTYEKRPLVVFISDDTKVDDYNVIAPIFEAKGVPCNFAIITGNTDISPTALTTAQLRELYGKGHGMLSHTHMHDELPTLTEVQLETDFAQSKAKIQEIFGEDSSAMNSLVYPYGKSNELVVKVARKHFGSAYATVGEGYLLNEDYLDQYVIARDVITYGGTTPRTLANLKPVIDKCKTEQKLLVFCIHAYEFIGEFSANVPLLESVIEYIQSIGVDIVTHDVAIEEKGNVLDIGTFKTPYLKISKSGAIHSSNLKKTFELGNSFNSIATVKSDTPLTSFESGKITKNIIYNAEATGFPLNAAGALFTHYNLAVSDMNFQVYYPQNSDSFYKRVWNRFSNVWASWKEFKAFSSEGIFDTVTRTIDTPLTSFPVGITNTKIGAAEKVGFPLGLNGLLVTNYVWENTEMNFQIFHPQNSYSHYKRVWNKFSNVWGVWMPSLSGGSVLGAIVTGRTLASATSFYVDIAVTVATSGDRIAVTSRTVITPGIFIDAIVSMNATVRVRFYNATAASVVLPDITLDITAIK